MRICQKMHTKFLTQGDSRKLIHATISTINVVYFYKLTCESIRQRKRRQYLRKGIEKACAKVLKQPVCLKISKEVNKADLVSKLTNLSCYQQSSKSFRIHLLSMIVGEQNVFAVFRLWMIFISS